MMLRRAVPLLLAIACAAHGADIAWTGAPGGAAPAGWSVQAKAGAQVQFLERAIEIAAANDVQALAVAAVDLPDGSDDRPLRVSAAVSAWGDRAVHNYPALVALEWADGSVFAVGLGRDPESRRDERRAWALWNGKGQYGSERLALDLFAGPAPVQVRIVVTARDIGAYASRDGWTWARIAGMPRERLGCTGVPARVVVGRGQLRAGAAGLAADPPADARGKLKPATYRFAELSVASGPAEVPAALMRTYAKHDSLADTLDAIAAAGRPRAWRIRGPDELRDVQLGAVLPPQVLQAAGWSEHAMPESGRLLQLGRLLPGTGSHVRWAAADLAMPEPGWVRLRFDGARRGWLWVAGRLVAVTPGDVQEAEPDRLAASVWLPAGTHQVVMGLTAQQGNENRSVMALRWEPGDPRWRIALLRRLAIDFPGDEALEGAAFEISRLWEGMGFAREAAKSLEEVVSSGAAEQVERARAERARLLNQLGDAAAADAEIAALQELWAGGEADIVSAARRAARLWQRLAVPERAIAVLDEAMARPGVPAAVRSELAVEQARLQRMQDDEPGVAARLRLAAEALPAGDQARFDLLAAALRVDPSPAPAALSALAAMATDAQRARVLAGLQAARKDEPGRLAARRAAAALPGAGVSLPAVELAEDLAAAKDEAGALKLYQAELERRRQKPAGGLAEARTQLLRAVLAEHPAGAALLAEAARVPAGAARALAWKACGPVAAGDWTAHENPAFDVAKGADAGPVAGKPWQDVPADAWQGGVLDLGRVGGRDNAVIYLATAIESDAERRVVGGFGADDGLSVWLNGERVYSDRIQRGLQADSIAIPLALRKGRNVLVCSVQNGGGPTAFQARLRREPWPGSDVAAILADAGGAARPAAASALAVLVEALAASDRRDQALALARAGIACWPDAPDAQLRLARPLLFDRVWALPAQHVAEVVAWFDALLADRRWDDNDLARGVAQAAPERMLEAGLVEECLARLRRAAIAELDPVAQANGLLRETDLWLGAGFPRQAAAVLARARDAAPGIEDVESKVAARQRALRARKGDMVSVASPFEIASLLRTADRAAGGGDAERAANDWQQAIEAGRDLPVPMGEGRMAGASALAAARLRAAGDAVLQAWLGRQAARAAGALERLGADAAPEDLDRIAQRWPYAPAAYAALRRAADALARDGRWSLALGAAQRALEGAGGPERGQTLVRAAHAAARLGDAAALEPLLAELARLGGRHAWDGRLSAPDAIAAALRALLPPAATADPRAAALVVDLPSYALARRDPGSAGATAAVLAVDGATVVATPDALAAFAADGGLRWRYVDPGLATMDAPAIPLAGESAALAAEAGTLVAGLRSGQTRRLVAVDLASGRPRWSSSDQPQLAAMALVSEPTVSGGRVWACFAGKGRGAVACLDLADGAPLWITTFGGGLARQPLVGGADLIQAGDAPAPLLRGRDLYVSGDAGLVGSFDAMDGRLQWLHAYPRTSFNPRDEPVALARLLARGRGAIQADAERVYVAPRDALGVLAIDRRRGALAWSAELVDVRELAQLTAHGLLAVGSQLCCFDPATGAMRWRSSRRAGSPQGQPAVVGDSAWFAAEGGLVRVGLAQGGASLGPTWKQLGLDRAPSALRADGARILASGDGVAAILAASGGAARGALRPLVEPVRGPAAGAPAVASPGAIAVRWELPLGRIESIQRPVGADPDEIYAIADGSLTRCSAASGAVLWSVPLRTSGVRLSQVAGDALLVWSDLAFAVFDRASGRLRWRGEHGIPVLLLGQVNAWAYQLCLGPQALVRWRYREPGWVAHAADDGRVLQQARVNGTIVGANVRGDELHLAIARGRDLVFAVYRISDGSLQAEVVSPARVDEWPSFRAMPDGALAIASRQGGAWWDAAARTARAVDYGLSALHAWWRDGERYVFVGQRDGSKPAASTLNPDGSVAAHPEIGPGWGEVRTMLHRADRWVGDVRLRLSPDRRNEDGIQAYKADGAELFRLGVGEGSRRFLSWVVPFGAGAIALSGERGGRRHAQFIDIPAGKAVCESAVPATPLRAAMPQAAGGSLLIGTERGLVALAPVAQAAAAAPGLAAQEPLTAWRAPSAFAIDGHLDEWADLARWDVPEASGAALALGWRDEGMAVALRIPRQPAEVGRTLLAIDPIRDGASDASPLILDLTWNGGVSGTRVVDMPVREDDERRPIQARARADGAGMVWEVLVPWPWLFPKGDRSSALYNLSTAALPTAGGAPLLELGGGLVGGFERSRFLRVRLVERKDQPKR